MVFTRMFINILVTLKTTEYEYCNQIFVVRLLVIKLLKRTSISATLTRLSQQKKSVQQSDVTELTKMCPR